MNWCLFDEGQPHGALENLKAEWDARPFTLMLVQCLHTVLPHIRGLLASCP